MVALIGCSSKKRDFPCMAKEMYMGSLFKKSILYCDKLKISYYILSAKFGLLSPEKIISPYDMSLNKEGISFRKKWSKKVNKQLQNKKINEVIILAGIKYHEFITIKKHTPLLYKPLGFQLQWLDSQIKNNKIKGLIYDK
jgi:cytoplasmic iron level regulating protein YaaA (DUF328/UPF0246 family)